MQTIDPILPRKPLRPGHRLAPSTVSKRLQKPGTGKSIDGVTTVPARPSLKPFQPLSTRQLPAHHEPSVKQHPRYTPGLVTPGLKLPAQHRFNRKQTIVVLVAAAILIGGALVTHQPLGQPLIVLYGIVALIKRVSSQITFTLALGTFIITVVSLVIIGGPNIISVSFAEYAFLLLIIGTTILGLELYRED